MRLLAMNRSFKINGADCGVEALVLGAVTSIGGFLFGYDTGQISGILLFGDFQRRFIMSDNGLSVDLAVSLLVAFMSIGCLIGSLSGA